MISINCLNEKFSTTRLVVNDEDLILNLIKKSNKSEDKFKTVLFLPKGVDRQGEGGLRTKGCFKQSYTDKPLITIITVVFNGEKFLEKAIQSVINQTYDNIEYIIIDGGSTDGTLDIIRKHEHAIDYWVSENDGGIYDAFNKAITVSLGDYYNIIGSDDVLFRESIKQVVDTQLKNTKVDFVVASLFLGEKLRTGMRPRMGWLGAHAMINGHSVGMLVRIKAHNVVGLYSAAYQLSADALFIKKMFNSHLRAAQSDVVMGIFSIDGVSNTNIAQGLCQNFLIQLETERFKFLQVIIFIARLIKNISRF
jgi:glycosyltransferase involved in cell wall biosynthesis